MTWTYREKENETQSAVQVLTRAQKKSQIKKKTNKQIVIYSSYIRCFLIPNQVFNLEFPREKEKFIYDCVSRNILVVVLVYIVTKQKWKKRDRQQITKQKNEFEDRIRNSYLSIHIHTGSVCKKNKKRNRYNNRDEGKKRRI